MCLRPRTRRISFRILLSHWTDPGQVLRAQAVGLSLPGDHPPPNCLRTFAERAMFLDTRYYLSDDILAKVDRASMGVSLEARIPFLDREVFDFAWSLPLLIEGSGRSRQVCSEAAARPSRSPEPD